MPIYAYECPAHGPFDSMTRADNETCPKDGCGLSSKRRYSLRINAESARHKGRWDPIVGEYVENDSQFRSKLAEGAERESSRLGMDVNLVTHDARDQEAAAELHGQKIEQRQADLEPTLRARHDAIASDGHHAVSK